MKCSNCENEATARGLCHACYMRAWRSSQHGSEAHRQKNWIKERRKLERDILKTIHMVKGLQEMQCFAVGTMPQDRLMVPKFLETLTGILECFMHEPTSQLEVVAKAKP